MQPVVLQEYNVCDRGTACTVDFTFEGKTLFWNNGLCTSLEKGEASSTSFWFFYVEPKINLNSSDLSPERCETFSEKQHIFACCLLGKVDSEKSLILYMRGLSYLFPLQ